MKSNKCSTTYAFQKAVLLPAATLSIALVAPAGTRAAEREPTAERATVIDEIIVTARRREESAQDVPISIIVFDQKQLSNRNVVNASDLALYTPGLRANTRFGDDNSSFSIRGFTQELRTTPSVGVYFAEVVAPRGGGSVTAGDGAGPGAYFDLQNVQVLKGPQGTLFGRNTTGGSVLLVPNKPTSEFGGYGEVSVGNFDMRRFQGVVNLPLGERARLRLGADQQVRDGYLENRSGIGPQDLSDIDYIAARASLVVDVTRNIENYTIFTYTDSKNNGSVEQVMACSTTGGFAALFGPLCNAQLAAASDDFYEVQQTQPDPKNAIKQWQGINTTTWAATDNLTIKNIISYADLETTMRGSVFGNNWRVPTFATFPGLPTGSIPFYFTNSGQSPGIPTNSQTTFVEELQFQGQGFDNRLTWQAGLYYERSKPDGLSGSQSMTRLSCDLSTLGADPSAWRCNDYFFGLTGGRVPPGAMILQLGTIDFENRAVFAQGTFKITDQVKLAGGIRYTWDETDGTATQTAYRFLPGSPINGAGFTAPTQVLCANPVASLANNCAVSISQDSEAPTWLVGLDYSPNQDVLLYSKYSRGYRQGGVVIFGLPGFDKYEPEQVDTYEIGAKTSFGGAVPGTFNVSIFYNDFQDQQLQVGLFPLSGTPTTGIVNAGASTIKGLEVETSVRPLEDLTLSASYTYLDTKVDKLTPPAVPAGLLLPGTVPSLTAAVGEPLSYSPKHQAAVNASYKLPVPDTIGNVNFGATYVYTAEQQAVARSVSPFAVIPSFELLSLNLNWNRIAGSNVDASLFATNVLNEEFWTFVPGSIAAGYEARQLGPPRMYGVRVRVSFGNE